MKYVCIKILYLPFIQIRFWSFYIDLSFLEQNKELCGFLWGNLESYSDYSEYHFIIVQYNYEFL